MVHYTYLHQCDKIFLPSPDAAVLMHHTKPGMSQQNLVLVSSATTCGTLFHLAGQARLDVFLESLIP